MAYPDADFRTALPLLRRAVDGVRHQAAVPLRDFTAYAAGESAAALAAHYVETFDFTNRHSLHLSWWTDGDTRRRGRSLLRFKDAYRAHGLEHAGEDLPDFLPAVLEFAAATGSDALLREHRPALELLRLALTERATPYARVLDSVCATLPGASPADRAAAHALARGGPPREEVGLEAAAYGHLGLLPVLTGDQR
ncbi:nitrate reductase molybdenum cofactor assembly chaperone [Streptomyces sp. CBMA29]|uniref:nitrate reductase molybdenum cofactor assembly chaperone n=1 Tax=Streptomyces sp. CBMA29 TaxID=1896314 RepID=UPI001CB71EE6|nr:nitrate reductase molybdenum cofactor assembly chaperone [Streptomyces sp. CBMA29]MBD0734250.1 nitrate reductase molybdenum cofactor assembly chaperone [Streptomyces sp. CBMA29]